MIWICIHVIQLREKKNRNIIKTQKKKKKINAPREKKETPETHKTCTKHFQLKTSLSLPSYLNGVPGPGAVVRRATSDKGAQKRSEEEEDGLDDGKSNQEPDQARM